MADTKKYNTHVYGTSCLRLLKPAAKIKFNKNQESCYWTKKIKLVYKH